MLRRQEEAGVDVVTDGELRRDNFFSFVAEKLDGVELLTLAEMLDIVEDKAAFELILQTLDAPGVRHLERGVRGQDRAAPRRSRSTTCGSSRAAP